MTTRRHGKELEDAILRAAWTLFMDDGYTAVTMQQVAASAGTSKPVLYRRWADRDALLKDAVSFGLREVSLTTPDTGSVRGDLVEFMTEVNGTLVGLAAVISVRLANYFSDTGATPADLHPGMSTDIFSPLRELLDRAVDRGEIDGSRLSPRITAMPLDLMRAEIVTTMRPMSPAAIEEIADTMFLPLVSPDRPGNS